MGVRNGVGRPPTRDGSDGTEGHIPGFGRDNFLVDHGPDPRPPDPGMGSGGTEGPDPGFYRDNFLVDHGPDPRLFKMYGGTQKN